MAHEPLRALAAPDEAATRGPRDAGDDVLKLELRGKPGRFRYLRLHMAERPADAVLTLCEVDVWGRR